MQIMSKRHKARQKDNVSSAQKGSDFERDLEKVYESMLNQDLVDAKVERRAKLKDSEGRGMNGFILEIHSCRRRTSSCGAS